MQNKKHTEAAKAKMRMNHADFLGSKNPAWKGGLISVECANCGNIVQKKPSVLKKIKNPFCDVKCFAELKIKNTIGEKNSNYRGGKVSVVCTNCGKEIPKIRSALKRSKNLFCSDACRLRWLGKDQKGEKNHNYIDGRSFEPYLEEFNNELKELIRSRDGYKCQKCGCSEIENGEKLSVHHIDYDKKNCLPSNLISLCRRCNSEVNKNRRHWTQCFRKKLAKLKDGIQLSLRVNKFTRRHKSLVSR